MTVQLLPSKHLLLRGAQASQSRKNLNLTAVPQPVASANTCPAAAAHASQPVGDTVAAPDPTWRWTVMPILMIMDIEGGTAEQYDRVDALLGRLTPQNAPAGLISHAAAVTDTGFMVADVWESTDDLQRFFDETLGAGMAEAGRAA